MYLGPPSILRTQQGLPSSFIVRCGGSVFRTWRLAGTIRSIRLGRYPCGSGARRCTDPTIASLRIASTLLRLAGPGILNGGGRPVAALVERPMLDADWVRRKLDRLPPRSMPVGVRVIDGLPAGLEGLTERHDGLDGYDELAGHEGLAGRHRHLHNDGPLADPDDR